MKAKIAILVLALTAASAAFAAEEPAAAPPTKRLPASVFPAVYVYYGVGSGAGYDGAVSIGGSVAAAGGVGELDDIGPLKVWGVTFDYFITPWLAADLKLTQENAGRHENIFRYDYSRWRGGPFAAPHVIREKLSYAYQNLDYKLGVRFVPFPSWPVTPYIGVAAGGNATVIRAYDAVSDPFIQHPTNGALMTNGLKKDFSFDWAAAGGAQVNVGANLFFVAEATRDRPFADHYLGAYRYHTGFTAYYGGVGWRFQ